MNRENKRLKKELILFMLCEEQEHECSLCLPVSLSLCHSVTLSLCHSVSLSLCHSVSLSLCLSVSLSLCLSVSLSLCLSVSLFMLCATQIPAPNNPFNHYMRRPENNSSLFLTPTDPMEISRIIT